MKLIKLLSFLLILSSCNKYLGTVEPDYTPINKTEEVFEKNIINQSEIKFSDLEQVIYPYAYSSINDSHLKKIKKIISLDENSSVSIQKDKIFFSKNDIVSVFNINKPNEKLKVKVALDKDEKIIQIINTSSNLFVLTDKTKLFLIKGNKSFLKANFNTFINKEIIIEGNKLITFSVFGEVLKIDLLTFTSILKDKFTPNHGVMSISNNYEYKNLISHLFNSGTIIFINRSNLKLENNYFIEDLNILSTVGYFKQLIDAPFEHQNYLYFIEKSGLVSVFDPITSDILWEVDLGMPIRDFNFTEDGKLILLSNKELIIFDALGKLIFNFKHTSAQPLKIVSNKNKILIFSKEGLDIIDLNLKLKKNYIKNKFQGDIEVINSSHNIFIKDKKNLYQISE
jgi:hypothetical protein